MEVTWANKPMDLRSADMIGDRKGYRWDTRTFECALCGNRLSEHELDDAGGLCPKDGITMRPLGRGNPRLSMNGSLQQHGTAATG